MEIEIQTPRWALPLLQPARYKVAYGGRASGKSWFFAEYIVERMASDPDLRVVCVREVQKSLKFSAKSLIENKIKSMGVSHLFDILTAEIRRKNGDGLCIFQGLSDHTADSIKSLENFAIAWTEEAQNLSARSLSLLRPTIRKEDSEILFSFNPENEEDAVYRFFLGPDGPPPNSIVVNANYCDNPFLPQTAYEEMLIDRERDTDYYLHIWMGELNVKSDIQVLSGKWRIDEFEPGSDWDNVFYGADWGFAVDPTTAIECWIHNNKLYVTRESWAVGLELDQTARRWMRDIPGIENHVVRADNARPESISFVKRSGISLLIGVEKWSGSVEDGIAFLRSFDEIVIHASCRKTTEECRLYQYKTNRAGDILPEPLDKNNHCIDALRYALSPLIKSRGGWNQGTGDWGY
jgi:phage terminase large subunit